MKRLNRMAKKVDPRIEAFAEYFNIDADSIHQESTDIFDTPEGAFYICDEQSIFSCVKERIEQGIADWGLKDYFENDNFQKWVLNNAVISTNKNHMNSFDYDLITEEALKTDEPAEFLSNDGKEIDLGGGYFAYRVDL